MKWKTTLCLLIVTVGVGAYISLYELRQPSPEERQQRANDILTIRPDSVTQLVLDLPQVKVTLTREGTVWKQASNGARADSERIEKILSALSPLVAERTLSPTAPHHSHLPSNAKDRGALDPKLYGLEPALGWIAVTSNAVATTLFIGDTTPVQHFRYLKLANRPDIFVVSPELFTNANVSPESFRDPFLIPANNWLIDGLTLVSTSGVFTLARRENTWHVVHPVADLADHTAVNALLTTVAEMKIKRVVNEKPQVEQLSQWGFDHPRAEVTLRQHDTPTPVTLFFGAPLHEDASQLYAKRSDEPFLYAVASADVDALLNNATSLRSKTCFEFFTSAVSAVEVSQGTAHWAIERKDLSATPNAAPGGAQWQERGTKTPLDTQRVEAFLDQLADLQSTQFLDALPGDATRYGFNPPAATITIWITGRPAPQRLLIGSVIESTQERYGRIEERHVTVRLPPFMTELLATTPVQLRSGSTAPPSQPSGHETSPSTNTDQ